MLEFCKQQNIQIEAYSPLAQAHHLADPTITAIASQLNKTPAQIMLRWAIQHGTIPIPKSTHPDCIWQNLQVFDFELSKTQMQQLDKLS